MLNKQILLTFAVLVFSLVLFEITSIDIWLQDHFYNFELKQWLVNRDEEIPRFIFYDGIKKLLVIFFVLLLLALIFSNKSQRLQTYKQGLLIVCVSAMLVPLGIVSLKAETNTPCPANISRYGGDYPYITVFQKYPDDFHQTSKIKCFPAGHASGGFAFLSLFFLFRGRRNKLLALASALIAGWGMGAYKMLIGDHFLSHTVVAMVLSWLIILLIAKAVYWKQVFER